MTYFPLYWILNSIFVRFNASLWFNLNINHGSKSKIINKDQCRQRIIFYLYVTFMCGNGHHRDTVEYCNERQNYNKYPCRMLVIITIMSSTTSIFFIVTRTFEIVTIANTRIRKMIYTSKKSSMVVFYRPSKKWVHCISIHHYISIDSRFFSLLTYLEWILNK